MDNSLKISIDKNLEKLGIQVESLVPINAGINSFTWEIRSKEKSYFLKNYKSYPNDKRNRLNNEINFIGLLLSKNFKNIPKPICFSREYNWAIFSWLNGKPVKNPNSKDWYGLINFLADIQKIKHFKNSTNISIASETFSNFNSHKNFIENRIKNFQLILQNNGLKDLNNWVEENLTNKIMNYKDHKYKIISKISDKHFEYILSPSDIGFHNCIKNNQKLFFFDFEYAGWDDPYKQYTDLIIQPENVLNLSIAKDILEQFSNLLNKEISIDLLREYIYIYRLKWTIIILKQIFFQNNNETYKEKIFSKAKSYYEKTERIWLSD
tara:strand:+ start:220 stop:1188 length:969 start_codon:yes stop_codon:yes gene_type:complete